MKRLRVYGFTLLVLVAVLFGVTAVQPGIALARFMPLSNRITTRPATVTLQAGFDQTHTKISSHVEYASWAKFINRNGVARIIASKEILAIQILVNGTPKQTRTIDSSDEGSIDIPVDLSSLSQAERANPIDVQAKTFWRYSVSHPRRNQVSATSATVHLQPHVNTTGGGLPGSGGNVTVPQTSATPDDSKLTTYLGGTVVKDEILVGLDLGLSNPDQRIEEIAAQTGAAIIGSVPGTATYQLRYDGVTLDQLESKRQALASMAGVSFASHHFIGSEAAVPNDNFYPASAWSGNTFNPSNWGLKYIKAPQAWDQTTGSKSTNIGIIDGEFNIEHPDLKQNISSITGVKTPIASGPSWHGTHVAGIACASGNNGIGITGINWQCGLHLYGVAIHEKSSALQTVELMKQAAADGNRVVNMSLGWTDKHQCGPAGNDQTLQIVRETNQVLERGIEWGERNNKDVLWVFSAGNECRDIKYTSPASLTLTHPSNTVAVAAVSPATPDKDAPLATFSNYGAGVTVAAPGENIYSTLTSCILLTSICAPSYGSMDGTSMAAPYVTGLAGLVFTKHPDFTASQARQCIVDAANVYGRSVPSQSFKTISAPEAISCQPPAPPTGTPDCIFERGTLRATGCESTNPTVEVRYFRSGACPATVEITWDENSPSTKEVFNVSDMALGTEKVLGRHTFTTPGDHWIKQDPRASTGESCVFVALSYLFRLK